MASETGPTSPTLDALAAALRGAGKGAAPVHLWNPDYCGEIDMRIAADGTWFYAGTPIGRPALVRLFASVLRRDPDRHVLVTPVERVGVAVDDAPFLAVEMTLDGAGGDQVIGFRTNVDDVVRVDADHPLRFEPGASGGLKPYVLVRGGLWALVARPLFYDLVAAGERRGDRFGVSSCGRFFDMADARALDLP